MQDKIKMKKILMASFTLRFFEGIDITYFLDHAKSDSRFCHYSELMIHTVWSAPLLFAAYYAVLLFSVSET